MIQIDDNHREQHERRQLVAAWPLLPIIPGLLSGVGKLPLDIGVFFVSKHAPIITEGRPPLSKDLWFQSVCWLSATQAQVEAYSQLVTKSQSLAWCSGQKVHCNSMKLSEEEKKILSGEKPALIWPGEDLLRLKRKSQTGKQKKKGNSNRPQLLPQWIPVLTSVQIDDYVITFVLGVSSMRSNNV